MSGCLRVMQPSSTFAAFIRITFVWLSVWCITSCSAQTHMPKQKAMTSQTQKTTQQKQLVVLIHGMARSSRAMNPLVQPLEKAGYQVLNVDYPSTKYPLETLATQHVLPEINRYITNQNYQGDIYVVTHSLGGIITRYIDHQLSLPHGVKIDKVVMLAPPNHGSEVVDTLGHLAPFYWVNGLVGRQLATKHATHPTLSSMPHQLTEKGQPSFTLGVIAGNKSADPAGAFLPNTPLGHDGKVTVESTKLDGMSDHIILPYSHTFLMGKKSVQKQILHFLKHSSFHR